jgi:class 3 adenylate cyclase
LILKYEFLAKSKLQTDLSESNEMLSMLMPWFVIERLNNFEISKNFVADDAGHIAILFCDIYYFDEVIKECQDKVVDLIDEIFRHFDQTCRQHGVQKIETVGKTYMACSGLKLTEAHLTPEQRSQSATERALLAAEEMMELASGFTYAPGKSLQLKIGIHYGTCIFGVLGYHKPQFSLIGDTINTTSRHCTCGDTGNITLSEQAWAEVKKLDKYSATLKNLDMKGKGKSPAYVLNTNVEEKIGSPKKRKQRPAGTLINFGKRFDQKENTKTIEEFNSGNVLKKVTGEIMKNQLKHPGKSPTQEKKSGTLVSLREEPMDFPEADSNAFGRNLKRNFRKVKNSGNSLRSIMFKSESMDNESEFANQNIKATMMDAFTHVSRHLTMTINSQSEEETSEGSNNFLASAMPQTKVESDEVNLINRLIRAVNWYLKSFTVFEAKKKDTFLQKMYLTNRVYTLQSLIVIAVQMVLYEISAWLTIAESNSLPYIRISYLGVLCLLIGLIFIRNVSRDYFIFKIAFVMIAALTLGLRCAEIVLSDDNTDSDYL